MRYWIQVLLGNNQLGNHGKSIQQAPFVEIHVPLEYPTEDVKGNFMKDPAWEPEKMSQNDFRDNE